MLILNNHNRDVIADIEGALSHLLALRLMKAPNRFVLRQMRAKIWAARFAGVVQKGWRPVTIHSWEITLESNHDG